MAENLEERLRELCLGFPDATEKIAWGEPTFRVRDRIFAMCGTSDGQVSVWCKSETELRDALISADPDHYFSPPYVGHKGWIGIRLNDTTDWESVANLVEESYEFISAKTSKKK